jgi:hypothetical protein
MTLKGKVLALAVVSMLVAGGFAASSALQAADPSQETGPVYSLEGAWYGMTNIVGLPPTPTLDTFTSNAQRSGVEGTFLCNIPAGVGGGASPSGHGNWVRIATNVYAYTAVRAIASGTTHVGWFKFWGTITAVSDNELTGTIYAQSYQPDWTPISPVFTGTIERHRIDITFE